MINWKELEHENLRTMRISSENQTRHFNAMGDRARHEYEQIDALGKITGVGFRVADHETGAVTWIRAENRKRQVYEYRIAGVNRDITDDHMALSYHIFCYMMQHTFGENWWKKLEMDTGTHADSRHPECRYSIMADPITDGMNKARQLKPLHDKGVTYRNGVIL